jgi:DNA-binding MarR family transcriptional regulator/GNAT superfamily N-acetyltransferase
MEASAISDVVRTFNRTVTQRVGALSDHYLSGDRPLGAARVLWEIGEEGCELHALRSRLALDSGYLSRLLRSLEGAGLITVVPSEADMRYRRAKLTPEGRDQRALLDKRSDELAQSMFQPLTDAQQERLVTAMTEVTTMLTATAVELKVTDPEHPQAQYCLRAYFAELNRRFPAGFDPADTLPTNPEAMRPPNGTFVLATLYQEPVGCGALKFHEGQVAEVKRVWVSSTVRGLGLGRRLLLDLERRAMENSSRTIRLDTNASLTEAIAIYREAGYQEVAAFNEEPYADHWFEKRLTQAAPDPLP